VPRFASGARTIGGSALTAIAAYRHDAGVVRDSATRPDVLAWSD
jgi:hypothetical protein